MGKDFKSTMDFINRDDEAGQPRQEEPKKKPRTQGKGDKPKTPPEKLRTRRVQTIFTPELYDKLSAYAWANRKSINGTIIDAVEDYLRRHK